MKTFNEVFLLVLAFPPMGALPWPDPGGNRTRREVSCVNGQEYRHGGICCSFCPAGTRVKSHCTTAKQKGNCEDCDYGGTFTEHPNGFSQCFKCTQCRSDQESVQSCTPTQDTECQCKSGRFCSPDQACEVCKICSRCAQDEEVVRNCTPTTNTECKKIQARSDSASENAAKIVAAVLIPVVLVLVCAFIWYKKKHRATDSQRDQPDKRKAAQQHANSCTTADGRSAETRRLSSSNWQLVRAKSSTGTEDERVVLCESIASSASNSQHSLTGLHTSTACSPLQNSPTITWQQPDRREEFPKLVPVKGEESLRKCFEYFEEIEVDYHKRFFRHLGITNNVIRNQDHLPYEDKIHDLLNTWVEKEGREASLNHLLSALLFLNQRRSAETIMEKALSNGHYEYEC